jgi:hypothetical protein
MKAIALLLPLFATGMNAAHAQANLLVNPSFEQPALTAASTCDGGTPWCLKGTANTPGWTQSGNGVTVIHNNYLGGVNPPILVTASNGVQYLDMNQVGGQNGGIRQIVATTPGQSYQLSLDIAAWASNAVGASVAYGLFDGQTGNFLNVGSFTASVGGLWTTQTLVATALSGSIGVEILSTFAPQAAIGIDNVVLSAVPEPHSCALLLAGLAGLAARARSGKAKKQPAARQG